MPGQQSNVAGSRRYMQTSQMNRLTLPVILSNSRHFQAPLELCKVFSHGARAFSDEDESTSSDGSAFEM